MKLAMQDQVGEDVPQEEPSLLMAAVAAAAAAATTLAVAVLVRMEIEVTSCGTVQSDCPTVVNCF